MTTERFLGSLVGFLLAICIIQALGIGFWQ
jgi:hypothetical protein